MAQYNESDEQPFLWRWMDAIADIWATMRLRWWIAHRPKDEMAMPLPSDTAIREGLLAALEHSESDWFHTKLQEESFLDTIHDQALCDELIRCLRAEEVQTPYGKVHVFNAYHRVLEDGKKQDLLDCLSRKDRQQLAKTLRSVLNYMNLAAAA